jgi:ABC-type uncharacterized transport system YnjBCD substrate-binding protein
MEGKEELAFPDNSVMPDDEILTSIMGSGKELWDFILKSLSDNYKDISWSWNYYNDGHQWLFKLVQKKKTILWAAVLATGEFRMTSYFGDKAEPVIEYSSLPEKVKGEFSNGQRYGKIRAITILVNTAEDAKNILKVADLKIKVK